MQQDTKTWIDTQPQIAIGRNIAYNLPHISIESAKCVGYNFETEMFTIEKKGNKVQVHKSSILGYYDESF